MHPQTNVSGAAPKFARAPESAASVVVASVAEALAVTEPERVGVSVAATRVGPAAVDVVLVSAASVRVR